MNRRSTSGRMSHQSLSTRLRSAIQRGEYRGGERLPARSALLRRFGACQGTLQKAITRLVGEGFLVTRQRQGTFVAAPLPSEAGYALLLTDGPLGEAIRAAIPAVETAYGVRLHPHPLQALTTENGEGRQLRERLHGHALRGLLIAAPSAAVAAWLAEHQLTLPLAGMGIAEAVRADPRDVWPAALRWLAERGRRRLAVIGLSAQDPLADGLRSAALATGLRMRPYWFQDGNGDAHALRAVTELLFRLRTDDRPDAVLITDEAAVAAVQQGLLDAGMMLPHDLDCVAHATFPLPTRRDALPCARVGWSATSLLEQALIACQGRPRPDLSVVFHPAP